MAKKSLTKEFKDALVVQGLLTIGFGITAIFWPGLTVTVLLYLVGAYLLFSGVVHTGLGVSGVGNRDWWVLSVLLGFVELGFGVYLLRHPLVVFSTFVTLIGLALLIRGLIELVSVIFESSGDETVDRVGLVTGFLALVAGIVVLYQTNSAGVTFVWILGVYAIVVGAMHLALARKVQE
jgi:uncharacterized membrane protein HdeD (DUF308 family)